LSQLSIPSPNLVQIPGKKKAKSPEKNTSKFIILYIKITVYCTIKKTTNRLQMSAINNNMLIDDITFTVNKYTNEEMEQSTDGVYIGTNETGIENVRKTLMEYPQLDKACHIGFSSWYNFDIMVQRKSQRAVICDFNPDVKEFVNTTLLYTISSKTRESFCEKIESYVEKNCRKFSPNVGTDDLIPVEEEIRDELDRSGSWLSTDEGFTYIKQLAEHGKISVITEDIRNSEIFFELSKIIIRKNVPIDTVYTSNISYYMIEDADKKLYQSTINNLVRYETKLIHSDTNLNQHVLKGSEFAENGIQIGQDRLFL
jgi:hypothetical protein